MTSGFFPLKHMMYLFQTIIPTVSQHMSDMSVDKRLQPVERLLRHTSYIILSSAMFLEKCYTYEDETNHNEDKSVAGNKSTTARGIPFGIEGCIEAEKQIWTWGLRRWRCSPSGCGRLRNEPGVFPYVFCGGKQVQRDRDGPHLYVALQSVWLRVFPVFSLTITHSDSSFKSAHWFPRHIWPAVYRWSYLLTCYPLHVRHTFLHEYKNTYITYSISLVIGPANKLTESPSGKEFHFIFSSLETGLYIGNVKIRKTKQNRK